MSCQGITRQSAALYRLLTQTIGAPKKRNRTVKVPNKKKKQNKAFDILNVYKLKYNESL